MEQTATAELKKILTSGTATEKLRQIAVFQAGGNSMLFSGGVAWQLHLSGQYKKLKGTAESVDEAMSQIAAVLQENTAQDGQVSIALNIY